MQSIQNNGLRDDLGENIVFNLNLQIIDCK